MQEKERETKLNLTSCVILEVLTKNTLRTIGYYAIIHLAYYWCF